MQIVSPLRAVNETSSRIGVVEGEVHVLELDDGVRLAALALRGARRAAAAGASSSSSSRMAARTPARAPLAARGGPRRAAAVGLRASRRRRRAARVRVGALRARCARRRGRSSAGSRASSLMARRREEDLREEVVDDEDEDAREHHRARRRLAHALGAAGGVQAEVAGRDRDDAAEDERLHQPLDEVVRDEAQREAAGGDLLPHRAPVEARGDADDERRDQVAADDADEVVDDGEDRQHDQRGEHPRGDQLLDRVGAEGVERVDLLGDAHGAELRGDAGADAAGDHEAGEHGAELADHRAGDEPADVHRGAERLELDAATGGPAPCR